MNQYQQAKGLMLQLAMFMIFFHLGVPVKQTSTCGRQNKNNYVIWYYCWRVLCGFHHSIFYSFLIAGHTKFSPDGCFGLLKQSFRRNFGSSLFDLMQTVDSSTVTGVNMSQLCGLHDGSVLVQVYDWAS